MESKFGWESLDNQDAAKRHHVEQSCLKQKVENVKKMWVEDVVKRNSRAIITVIIIPISVYLLKFFPLLRVLMEV